MRDPGPPELLSRLREFRWVRGHISVFAVGAVLALAANLLLGGGIWADTLIGAWAILIFVHVIIAVMARLIIELLKDDEDEAPAPIVIPSTPTQPLPPQSTTSPPPVPMQAPPVHQPTRQPLAPNVSPAPAQPPVGGPPAPRVSWRVATDAAQLSGRPATDASAHPSDNPYQRN